LRKLCQPHDNFGRKKIIFCCDWSRLLPWLISNGLRVTPHNQVNLDLSVFCRALRKLCQPYDNFGGKKIIFIVTGNHRPDLSQPTRHMPSTHVLPTHMLLTCLATVYQEAKLTTCSDTLRQSSGMRTARMSDHYVNLPCYVAFTRKLTHVLLTATFHNWTCTKSHVSVTVRSNNNIENHENKDRK
jgi:hypothetical protein